MLSHAVALLANYHRTICLSIIGTEEGRKSGTSEASGISENKKSSGLSLCNLKRRQS